MATYGFATGSNLTDLGRNLVAQEQTRNALQAALAAAAAQRGVANTQAGASRYSTDAQREGNQLMAMLRQSEQERLRQATEMEAGLKGRDLTLRDTLGRLQFGQNTPEAMMAERAHEIEIAKIAAEAQKAINQRVDPRFASTLLEANLELDQIIKALPGLETMANAKSDSLFNSRGDWRYGDAREKADYQTLAFDITSDPKYGAFGKYLIPDILPDGRVRFKANPPSLLPVPGASAAPTPTLSPVPLPPSRLSVGNEFESDASGPLDYGTLPTPNVPRRTNNVPTLPMLPVTPDTEPGFFSRLGRALTGPDALPIPTTDPGFLTTRTAGGPPTPFTIVIEGSPFQDYWRPLSKDRKTAQVSPEDGQERIGEYIKFLLGQSRGEDAIRSAVAVRELARVRRVLGQ